MIIFGNWYFFYNYYNIGGTFLVIEVRLWINYKGPFFQNGNRSLKKYIDYII